MVMNSNFHNLHLTKTEASVSRWFWSSDYKTISSYNLQKIILFEDLKRWYQLIFFLEPLVVHSFLPLFISCQLLWIKPTIPVNFTTFLYIFSKCFQISNLAPLFTAGSACTFVGVRLSLYTWVKKWRTDPVTIVPRFDLLRVTGRQRPRLLYNWDVVCAQHLGRATTLLLIWETWL